MRRKKGNYFEREQGDPTPLQASITHQVSFSEVDAMAIVWHGRYPQFFESSLENLSREIGLSYKDYFDAGLRAPIVQHHVDYHSSIQLEEVITITARLIWSEAARLNTEYCITKEDGSIAATGYTVQMFIDGDSGDCIIAVPELIETCMSKWQKGEFKNLQ